MRTVQQRWLGSRSSAVATATALQALPRHPRSHLLLKSQNGFENGTLWLDKGAHGRKCVGRRLKDIFQAEGEGGK